MNEIETMGKRDPPATVKVNPDTWECALGAMKTSALKTSAFKGHWLAWVAYRRDVIKKPVTEFGATRAIRKIEKWGCNRAIAAIRYSMDYEWRGIFEAGGPRAERNATRVQAASGKYDNVRVHRK